MAKLARDVTPKSERLQPYIEKCITNVASNAILKEKQAVLRDEKYDTRWTLMLEKQDVNIGLLKGNIAAKKRKEDLALMTADTSTMDEEVKACYKEQHNLIFKEMRAPPTTSTPPTSSTPPATSCTPEAVSTHAEDVSTI
jgi:hypothetical protein